MEVRKSCRLVIGIAALSAMQLCYGTPNWYRGPVNRVAVLNGNDFVVTFSNTALSDCADNYVYFRESALGADKIRKAYASALLALASGQQMGVVIDKAINGSGGICDQMGAGMFDVQP